MSTNNPFATVARLTQIALAVKPYGMIADLAAPRVPVPDEEFVYTKFSTEDRFTLTDTRIGRKSEPNQVELGGTDVTASTEDRGLDDFVPQKDLDRYSSGATAIDPSATAVEGLAALVDLDREKKVADLYNTLTTFASSLRTTLSGTSQWSHASSTPVTAIMQAMDTMLVRPNVLICSREVFTALRTHAQVVAAVLGAAGVGAASGASGVVSEMAMADLFGLQRILVGETFYNSAKPGQAASYARLWGKHATLARIDPAVRNVRGGAMPTFLATAEWQGRRTRIIPEPKRGIDGGNTYRVAEQIKELVLWQEAAYHFHDAAA
jgi:hypothetical protein